jgi:Saxitoxin biosynthesis operon protein SxtJ
LTAREGRRFGFTVGAAFLVLAAIGTWRGGGIATSVFLGAGVMLAAAGALVPTHLGPVERGWMRAAHAISTVTTPIVMSVLYLLVLTPVGVLRRTLGGNPLVHRRQGAGYWQARPAGARKSASLERQF